MAAVSILKIHRAFVCSTRNSLQLVYRNGSDWAIAWSMLNTAPPLEGAGTASWDAIGSSGKFSLCSCLWDYAFLAGCELVSPVNPIGWSTLLLCMHGQSTWPLSSPAPRLIASGLMTQFPISPLAQLRCRTSWGTWPGRTSVRVTEKESPSHLFFNLMLFWK